MKRWILQELLDRYERSKAFREGRPACGRRIQIRVDSDASWNTILEDPDKRREFLDSVEELRRTGLVDYTWVRYEEGNLIERIWLIPEEEALKESYRICGRIGMEEQLQDLEQRILKTLDHLDAEGYSEGLDESGRWTGGIRAFLEEMLSIIRDSRMIPRWFFRGNTDRRSVEEAGSKNENLLRFLVVLSQDQGELLERVVSTRLYGDSKYFERELKTKVISVLKHIAQQNGESCVSDEIPGEILLEERGIMRWPEILEFCGGIRLHLENGQSMDFSSQIYGAYVNSDTVRHTARVEVSGVRKVLSIENKANYTWYIATCRKEEELVLYHGGVFSPVKGRWMKLIAGACAGSAASITYSHWSDIDLGGFRIFHRLRKEIFREVLPVWMDVETLRRNLDRCIHIDDDRYINLLYQMRKDPEYQIFYDTLDYMLENRIRLEQEAEI